MRWIAPILSSLLIVVFCVLLFRPKPLDPVAELYEGKLFDYSMIADNTLSGASSIPLKIDKSKPTVINFWASWCTECEKETGTFNELNNEYGDRINLISINVFDQKANARKAHKEWKMNFNYIEDVNSRSAINMGVSSLPVTYVISSQGLISKRFWGPVEYNDLREYIN